MQTLILTFIIPVIAVIFTAVFLALWWNDRKQLPILAFAACFAAMALGVVINIWIFSGLDPVGVVAYHVFSMAGLLALMWGVAERANVKAPLISSAISVAIASPILWFSVVLEAPETMRMAQNTSSAIIILLIAMTAWHGTKRYWFDNALTWVLCALAGFGFLRPMLNVFGEAIMGSAESGRMLLMSIHVLVLATLLTLMALCLVASIIQDRMRSEREEAAIDSLSGLPNRKAFETEAKQMIERARIEGAELCLIIADIDHFKQVNDRFGHTVGDKVIAGFGALLSQQIRPKDVCGRIGGEEFCVLLYNCGPENAEAMANRVRIALKALPTPYAPAELSISASFGVAAWPHTDTYETVFDRADAALFKAKRRGRDRVTLAGDERSEDATEAVKNPAPADVPNADFHGAQVVSLAERKTG